MRFEKIKDYDDYFIDINGNVYSEKNKLFLRPRLRNNYLSVVLYKNGKPKSFSIHRLVAETFLEKPKGIKLQVNHKNGTKTDNFVENLEWVTPKQNTNHAIKTGLINNFGKNNPVARRILCKNTGEVFDCIIDAAKKYNLSSGNIVGVCCGKRKHTKGFIFNYQ